VRIPVTTAPPPAPVLADPPVSAVVAQPAPEERRGTGVLTVSSMPRAQVMVDGVYVRYTPIYQYSVSSGSHSILLVTEDGRRKSFKVDVIPGSETRRIWLFDEEKWSD
jgi:hypothetical protein